MPTRFAILTNELPKLGDASGALGSRFILLLMTNSFYGREDHGLTDRLLTELPGILNWAIAGWADAEAQRPFQTTSVGATGAGATRRPVESNRRFRAGALRDRRVLHVEVEEHFRRLGDMVRGARPRPSGHKQSFGRDLSAAVPGLTVAQLGSRGEQVRVYQGLKLKGEWSERRSTTPGF